MSDLIEDPSLTLLVRDHERLLRSLAPPMPQEALLERLRDIGTRPPAREEVRETLALLLPGTIQTPRLSEEATRRLLEIPGQLSRKEAGAPEVRVQPRVLSFSFVRDWRVAVVAAYAAALVVVALLGVDPVSAARSTASGFAVKSQHALAQARDAASDVARRRLDQNRLEFEGRTLSRRLDTRIYRAIALTKATAAAWGTIMMERAFTQAEAPSQAGQRRNSTTTEGPGRTGLREPDGPDFRS